MTFSMTNFISEIVADGRRIGKSYLYQVTLNYIGDVSSNLARKMTFFCSDAAIPGWKAATQYVSIYGLGYEVPTKLEQDPLWLSFYIDAHHRIPDVFFSKSKANFNNSAFSGAAFAPRYKDDFKFQVTLNILDANFDYVHTYSFENCFVRTVQQVPLSAGDGGVPKVTVEIVYEWMNSGTNLSTLGANGDISPRDISPDASGPRLNEATKTEAATFNSNTQ